MKRRALADDAVLDAVLTLSRVLDDLGPHVDPAVERAVSRSMSRLSRRGDGGHVEIAVGITNLALVLHRRGDLDNAVRLYEKGIAIRRAVQGDDHPDLTLPELQLSQALAA